MTILLTNTDAATGSDAPQYYHEILTGLFFNLGTSSNTFTPLSATIQPGGAISQTSKCDYNCSATGLNNVGGEWSYAYGGAPFLSGTNRGVSTGYLNANTSAGNFNGNNYEDFGNPNNIGGIEFGIVPDGFEAYSGKPANESGIDGEPLIEGTVQFVLNIPDGLTEDKIKDVYFTYGDKGVAQYKNFQGQTGGSGSIPEPAALSMLGLALAGLGYRMRRVTPKA